MKRFTAILTVLCIALSAVSCKSGGSTAASATVHSTASQNTTEKPKTESTTSKTEAPQKPQFVHPAIEEIGGSIEHALEAELKNANINAIFRFREENEANRTQITFTHSIRAQQTASGQKFTLQTRATSPNTYFPEKNIYFDGSDYFVSYFGINAKIPPSGMENVTEPQTMLKNILVPLPKDLVPLYDTTSAYTHYTKEIPADRIASMFEGIVNEILKEAKNKTGEECKLEAKSANMQLNVKANGKNFNYLSYYQIKLVFSLKTEGEMPKTYDVSLDLSANIFTGNQADPIEEPEGTEKYAPISSQSEIFVLLLNNATDKINASKLVSATETLCISKKELTGNITPISVTVRKTLKQSEGGLLLREITSYETGMPDAEETDVYAEGAYFYVKEGESTLKYTQEEFESVFGYLPDIKFPSFKDEITSVSGSYSDLHAYQTLATLDFEVDPAFFAKKFAEQTARAAKYVAGEREIWNYTVKNARVTAAIDKNGNIQFYGLYFDMEVTVIINGKKFALKAEVTDSVSLAVNEESLSTQAPEGYESYPEFKNQ